MNPIKEIYHRLFPPRPFNEQLTGFRMVGVEVGVGAGKNAKQICLNPNVERLYLVDPYQAHGLVTGEAIARVEREAKDRLWRFGKVRWLKLPSVAASRQIKDLLDFVYLDGLHDEISLDTDIATWWPLVRRGGLIGGHDFHPTHPGVIRAVTKWAVAAKVDLCVVTPDWWVRK